MNLYLRLLILALRMLPMLWRQRHGVLDESRIPLRVLPNDCDVNLHMNNGRYLSFMDLGRVHYIVQIGLLRLMVARGWRPVLAAAEITFIRPLNPLQKTELVTRVLTWDEKYVYMEQLFERDGELHAHAFVKGLFLGKAGRVATETVLGLLGHRDPPPPMPDELRIWSDLGNAKKQRAESEPL